MLTLQSNSEEQNLPELFFFDSAFPKTLQFYQLFIELDVDVISLTFASISGGA